MTLRSITFFLLLTCFTYITNAQEFRLTVQNGYGSGVYKAGDTVRVWANKFLPDSVFNGWGQSIKLRFIISPREWNTLLIMPGVDVTVTATFAYSAPLRWNEADVDLGFVKKHVWFSVPNNPRGLITLHHFTNGRGKVWTERTEYTQFCHAATAMGFGLLAYNCDEVDRGPQDNDKLDQWKAFPVSATENPDHRSIRAMLDSLIRRGTIISTTPVFAVGMSVGGGYTLSVATVLGYKAWANYCSGGPLAIADFTTVPGIQAPAINDANGDDVPIGENNKKAREVFEKLSTRGIRCEWLQNLPQPLYPQRFARIEGITIQKSTALFRQLKENGFLDTNNIPKIQGDTLEYVIRKFPNVLTEFSSLPENLWKEALYQYRVAYADHEFHSNFTYATLYFFESILLQTTDVPNAPTQNTVTVTPNPATESIILQLQSNTDTTTIELYNAMGTLLHTVHTNTGITTLPLSNDIPNGVYFLRMNSFQGNYSTSFVVQR